MKRPLTLKKNHEFQRLYRRGASAVGGSLVIYCRKNRLSRNRVGLTASTKLGNAVQRNRARRRMREVYRLNADKLRPGWDLVLVARSRTLSAPWPELNATFFRLCKKLGLLREA
ncbi:MAG: ribonuclease P protein component [Oscillibacter sp.]|nr:ribonuclease P protein component [Oscillibacter sp.]